MTTVPDLYAEGRARMLVLAQSLTAADAATSVPACPGWTVKDVYAHLAGICDDVLAGTLTAPPTDEQTAAQVEARRDRSLTEICADWSESGPRFEDGLRMFGDKAPPQPVFDVWNHEQDVRGALGRPGSRELPVVAWIIDTAIRFFGRGWAGRGLPTVRMITESGERLLGDGDPVTSVTTTDFDLARTLIGHRSRAQAVALGWDPPATDEVIDAMHGFEYAREDIVE